MDSSSLLGGFAFFFFFFLIIAHAVTGCIVHVARGEQKKVYEEQGALGLRDGDRLGLAGANKPFAYVQ